MYLKKILQNKKAIIMDFDGTITNTEPLNFKTWHYLLESQDIDFTENDFKDILGHSVYKILDILEKKYQNFDRNKLIDRVDDYIETFKRLQNESNLQMFDYVKEILENYNDIPKFILSNQIKVLIDNMLTKWKIEDKFIKVYSCLDEKLKKQDFYENAEKYFGVKASDCLLCEDSQIYIDEGKKVGMTTLGIQHNLNAKLTADYIINVE